VDPQDPTAFEFGGFRLDGRRRLLLDADGNVVPLTGKTFDALVFFVERAGEVVERAALMEALWPGVIVEENSLSQVVLLLRRALGDGFIVTIKGRGYQFVEDVQVVSVNEADARPNETSGPGPDRRPPAWLLVATLGVALVATIAWIAAGRYSSGDAPDQRSVAVLPFENLSASEADAVFVDGMHNDIVTQLAKIGALRVTSRASVLEYRGRARNLREIGETLGVATVLEGAVQRAVDAVRVNVQLIDARTDEHIWAETYDFEPTAGNLFTIQSRIATSVADALRVAILPSEATRLGAIPTESSRAYDFFLSAREYDRRDSRLAERQYERAVQEDPGFALAWAYLSWWHMETHWFRIDGSDARKRMALEAAKRALALEPDLPEAHIALGWYYFKAEQRYEAALKELAIAERGMPGDIAVPWSRGNVLRWAGRWDEAFAEFDRAARLDPRNTVLLLEPAEVHIALRDYAAAERQLDRILEMLPDHVPSLVWKTMIPLLRDGDVAAANGAVEDPTYPSAGTKHNG
jgi:TolB-like protein/DNA-binding winged helix-turn-helix (wHTH) protein/Tfp pilus assembly protein PilF